LALQCFHSDKMTPLTTVGKCLFSHFYKFHINLSFFKNFKTDAASVKLIPPRQSEGGVKNLYWDHRKMA